MTEVYLDSETRSPVNLKTAGAHRYFADDHTDVIIVTYAIDDGPVFVWRKGQAIPYDLIVAITDGALVYIHNAEFDLTGWNEVLHKRQGWPRLDPMQVRCTAAMAAAMSLPRSLDGVAQALRLSVVKDKDGGKLMRLMCKPKGYDDDLKPVWHETTEQMDRLVAYARTDIDVLRGARRRLLDLRPDEQMLFDLTRRINANGVRLDLKPVRAAIPMVQDASKELNAQVRGVTNEELLTAMQRDKLLAFLGDHLVLLPNARKKTLALFLAQAFDHVPGAVKSLIGLRLEAAKTSTAKLTAMVSRVSADQRLRGFLVYHGAATGRYTSVGVQLQNLPRPIMNYQNCCAAVETLRAGDRDLLDWLYGSTLQTISDCLRSFFIPAPGHCFVVADYTRVEAIVNAWASGQTDLLDAFASGRDTYAEMASLVFGRAINRKVDKVEGHVGKGLILGAGYGLGGRRFWENCILDGIPISLEFAEDCIAAYRQTNDCIVGHWYDQERAAITATLNPGSQIDCGVVSWRWRAGVLWCRLPSGRALAYPYAVVRDRLDRNKTPRPRLHYRGIHPLTRQWAEIDTYGAALVENIVQAIARDLLTRAMLLLDSQGMTPCLTVHDELACETRRQDGYATLMDAMKDVPAWGRGIPLMATGASMDRYGKLE